MPITRSRIPRLHLFAASPSLRNRCYEPVQLDFRKAEAENYFAPAQSSAIGAIIPGFRTNGERIGVFVKGVTAMMKRIVFLAAAVVFGATLGSGASRTVGAAEQKAPASGPLPSLKRPDLTVTMQPKKHYYQRPDGTNCVSYRPGTIVVTNIGTATAVEGYIGLIEWNNPVGSFTPNTQFTGVTLGPGGTMTKIYDQGTSDYTWCPGTGAPLPSWRVTVDHGDKIKESNETNNTVEKQYQPKAAVNKQTKPPALAPREVVPAQPQGAR